MRTNRKLQQIAHFYNAMEGLGFKWTEIETLRRAQLTLRSWAEKECGIDNGCIERNETTGKPYWHNSMTGRLSPVRDMEHGALQRISAVMADHPTLTYYHQTDPRGCALYIIRKDTLKPGDDISSVYNRGFGVCI